MTWTSLAEDGHDHNLPWQNTGPIIAISALRLEWSSFQPSVSPDQPPSAAVPDIFFLLASDLLQFKQYAAPNKHSTNFQISCLNHDHFNRSTSLVLPGAIKIPNHVTTTNNEFPQQTLRLYCISHQLFIFSPYCVHRRQCNLCACDNFIACITCRATTRDRDP